MILGIGIDIVDIPRMKKACQKERFLERVFTQKEIDYFNRRNNNISSIAGIFAAKEAFSKALGTGISGFSFSDIEINHDERGKPILHAYGGAKDRLSLINAGKLHLSITHSGDYAVAQVVIERDE